MTLPSSQPDEFSLIAGGPVYRVARALAPPLRPPMSTVSAAVALAAIAWVPLAVVARLHPGSLEAGVLDDVSVWARMVVAVPLLVLAEVPCARVLGLIIQSLVRAGVVPESEHDALRAIIDRAIKRRDSMAVEIFLVALAFGTGRLAGMALLHAESATWGAGMTGGAPYLTSAGWWYTRVSLPIMHLLMYRWLWRLFIWVGILRGVAGLNLHLVASHPDGTGGLGIIKYTPSAFTVVALAYGTVFAGALYKQIGLGTISLASLKFTIPAFVVLLVVLFAFGPLAFVGNLIRLRWRGEVTYGRLAHDVGYNFEQRWMRDPDAVNASALEQPDFSATIDLFSVVGLAYQLKFAPFGWRALVPLTVAAALPSLVVVVTVVPVAELLKGVAALLF